MKKILYFDTETTGLNPVRNNIIQIAGIVVIGGVEKESFNIKLQPVSFDESDIDQGALDIHGYSVEDLRGFITPLEAYNQLINIFSRYINRYDKNDKFTPAGYNVRFDIDFLREFFVKMNDKYYGSWFCNNALDPFPVAHFLANCGLFELENYKLSTVCQFFGIEIDAHDALSDIRATRELTNQLYKRYIKPNTDLDQFHQLGKMVAGKEIIMNEFLTPAPTFKQANQIINELNS